MMSCMNPEAITTAPTPLSAALRAAATFASIPPRPRADLSPKETREKELRVKEESRSGSSPGSGLREYTPCTSVSRMSSSALSSLAISRASESLSVNRLRSSGRATTSFSLMTGTPPMSRSQRSDVQKRRRRSSHSKSRSVTSSCPHATL